MRVRTFVSGWCLMAALAPSDVLAGSGTAGRTPEELILAGWIVVFEDDFESAECSLWSASSNPQGAPDGDTDLFGDENSPTTYCQLPAGNAPEHTDCDDNDPAIHPGAVEICNGLDDNCVGGVDEGFDLQSDEANCGSCGNVCEPINCTNTCLSGICTPVCLTGYSSCDGDPDDGCETAHNANPVCAGHSFLGTVSGDTGNGQLLDAGLGEEWGRFTLSEDNDGNVPLSATIQLVSPAGADYDLYVYCMACGGSTAGTSTVHSLAGHTDTVLVRADDDFGFEDTHDLLIEVRFFQGGSCVNWQLSVLGNTTAPAQTCNP